MTYTYDYGLGKFKMKDILQIGKNTYSTRNVLIGGESSPKFQIIDIGEVRRIGKDDKLSDPIDLDRIKKMSWFGKRDK